MVVEDDTDILELLTLAFTDAGYTVLPWDAGVRCASLHSHRPARRGDSGLVVGASPGRQYGVRVAHDRPATQQIPVIISSAYRHLLDAEEAHLRAQGYVLVDKPYRVEDLLAAVHMLLGDDHAHAVGA